MIGILGQVLEELRVGQLRRLLPPFGGDERADAAELGGELLDLGLGERLLDQIALLQTVLSLREKLPRRAAPGSGRLEIELGWHAWVFYQDGGGGSSGL